LQARFHRLVDTQGVSGHEADVRELVRAQLPSWAHPQVDSIGNLSVTLGRGAPHTVLVATLDENGYVVSRITDDGYLRLHRPGPAPANVLHEQYMVGQPVMIRSASGRLVPGVTATPSLHLRRLLKPDEIARVRDVGDLWVDVGAANAAAVAQLGIRTLDPVNLRERAQSLADGRVAGLNTQLRAGAQALVELLRGLPSAPAPQGTVTLVWTVQSQFNERGLAVLAQAVHPARAIVIGGTVASPKAAPAGWSDVPIAWKSIPALFENTPVETVDVARITALVHELAGETGLAMTDGGPAPALPPLPGAPTPRTGHGASGPFAMLKPLIETYGVSGHEAPVRDLVRRMLPSWAKPVEDEAGNLTVSFGQGGKELLFVAHLDEIGFEITGLRADGTATLRDQGGMYLALYEAQPVWVHTAKGRVAAVIAPRPNYATATGAQPDLSNLVLYFGTHSAAGTQALGVAAGQSASVRKQFVELAAPRATGRAMDDRAGITALLMALQTVDPATVKNRVTVAFSVGEETGLTGARALAKRVHPQVAFAIDTFVSTDTPTDPQYLAHAPLGQGAVLRGMDNLILTPAPAIDRIVQLAQDAKIPLQVGVTQGGVDSAAFSAGGAIDVGLSWPGRYSHSPVEIIDQRDLVALSRLIATLMRQM
jgi:putative aminopeptidase